jgi:AhpD family alkylhydroperoxidase
MARVKYVSSEEAQGDSREILAALERSDQEVLNLYRTVANTPVLRNFMRLGGSLLGHGVLSPKLREVVILRTAQLTGADYEWAHHIPIARAAGVRDEQIESLRDWQHSPAFDAREQATLRFAEAVHARGVTDEIYNATREHLSEPEIVETTLVVGFWGGLVALTLLALSVDIEPDFQRFAPH